MTIAESFVRRQSTPPWGCPPWCDLDHNDPEQEPAYDDPQSWTHRGPVGEHNFDIWLSDRTYLGNDEPDMEAILTVEKLDHDGKPGRPTVEIYIGHPRQFRNPTRLTPGEARSIAAALISGADKADGLR